MNKHFVRFLISSFLFCLCADAGLPPVASKNHGTILTAVTTSLNFAGAGVVATNSSGAVTVTISGGSSSLTPLTKTANYTVLSTDSYIRADATSGGFTLTLPTAAGGGQVLYIKKIDATYNVITFTPNGGDLIDGETSQTVSSPKSAIILVSSGGTDWDIF